MSFPTEPSSCSSPCGDSWTNAYATLEPALLAAQSGDEIRVAQGTYIPTTAGGFEIKEGLTVLGGFRGGTDPPDPDRRLPKTFVTTLSGALAGGGRSDRVVFFDNTITNATLLDGFRITGGGNLMSSKNGGGVRCQGSPVIKNNIIEDNEAPNGAGIWVGRTNDPQPDPQIIGNIIRNNSANSAGGGIYAAGCVLISGNTIRGNSAGENGGGIYVFSHHTNPSIWRNTILENSAGELGGGLCIGAEFASIRENIIVGNTAVIGGGVWGTGDALIEECHIEQNKALDSPTTAGFGGGVHWDACPAVENECDIPIVTSFLGRLDIVRSVLSGNFAERAGGGFYGFVAPSAAIAAHTTGETNSFRLISSVVVGNKGGSSAGSGGGGGSYVRADATNEFAGPHYRNSTFSENCGIPVGGGVHTGGEIFNSSIFWNNYATDPLTKEIDNGDANDISCTIIDDGGVLGGINQDPLFVTETGTWGNNNPFNSTTFQTTFRELGKSWTPGEFVGHFLNPDTGVSCTTGFSHALQLMILANTNNTVTVWGDHHLLSQTPYRITDFHVHSGSPAVDRGDNDPGLIEPELLALDLDGLDRRFDDPDTADNGPGSCIGTAPKMDLGAYEYTDCNDNDIHDRIDVLAGSSMDLNENGIPDECDDCNNNGMIDTSDIASGAVSDADGNAIPDECELGACCDDVAQSCTDNVEVGNCTGRFEKDETCASLSPQCGIGACCRDVQPLCLDFDQTSCSGEWSPGETCSTIECPRAACINAAEDCDVDHGKKAPGCNDSSCCEKVCAVDELCCTDTWDGVCATLAESLCAPEVDPCPDVPEAPEVAPAPLPDPAMPNAGNGVSSRYISFIPPSTTAKVAILITLVSVDGGEPQVCQDNVGLEWWVQAPEEVCENAGQRIPPGGCGASCGVPLTFQVATLGCSAVFIDWPTTIGTGEAVYVYGKEIFPNAEYHVHVVREDEIGAVADPFSQPFITWTSIWGDVCGGSGCADPPDGSVDLPDVIAVLDKWTCTKAILKALTDVEPQIPDQEINISDVTFVLNAFSGDPYPFCVPAACP